MASGNEEGGDDIDLDADGEWPGEDGAPVTPTESTTTLGRSQSPPGTADAALLEVG